MTSEEKKEWLSRYINLNRSVDQKVEELSRLRSLCEKVTTTFSDVPKGKSDIQNAYARLVDLQREINCDIDSFINMRDEIEPAIDTVADQTLRNILRYRYINGLTWEMIAERMRYSYQWVCKLHGDALMEVQIDDRN